MSTPPYDGREVANFLLDYSTKRNIALTQISLLKILYFCHGWYLVYNDTPLVKNEFEAWENGPVIRVVRNAFKQFGSHRITGRATKFNLNTGLNEPVLVHIQDDDRDFIKQVFEEYYRYSPWELRDMTHEKGSPWDNLWNSEKPLARCGLRIKNEEIQRHFRLKAHEKSGIVIKS